VVARENKVPVYACVPTSTIDLALKTGAEIPIEERNAEEVTKVFGLAKIAPEGCAAYNPAFDVTPARFVTAIVTEEGVCYPPFEKSLRLAKQKAEQRIRAAWEQRLAAATSTSEQQLSPNSNIARLSQLAVDSELGNFDNNTASTGAESLTSPQGQQLLNIKRAHQSERKLSPHNIDEDLAQAAEQGGGDAASSASANATAEATVEDVLTSAAAQLTSPQGQALLNIKRQHQRERLAAADADDALNRSISTDLNAQF
jgi:hypothetical protein